MSFQEINHVKSIEYKGIHRKSTINNTIKKINDAIDRFNTTNRYIHDEMSSYAVEELQNLINKRIPEYSGIILKSQNEVLYGNDMQSGLIKEIGEIEKERTKGYNKIIAGWTKNSNLSPKQINDSVDLVVKNLDSKVKMDKDNIKKICNGYISQKVSEIEKSIDTIIGKKLSQLQKKSIEWIDVLDDCIKKIPETLAKTKNSIDNLKNVAANARGKLGKEDISIIENIIKSVDGYKGRGWVKGEIKRKPIYRSDDATNKLLLSLMGIFTDTAGNKTDFIGNYLSKSISELLKKK